MASTTDVLTADQLASLNLPDAEGTEGTTKPKVDPDLWKAHPPTEECPVCLVPLPLANDKATYWPCCGQTVCNACDAETDRALRITNRKRKDKELPPMEESCAFCREPTLERGPELIKRYEKRVDKGDVKAMVVLRDKYRNGDRGLARDEAKALELLQRAADSGFPEALGLLGYCFIFGDQGVIKDGGKGWAYLEDAAKAGDVVSRVNLGEGNQHHDLAIKHFKLAAAAGYEPAMKELWKYFPSKLDKAELEETLRAHKSACDDMNSEERERFEAMKKAMAGNDDILKTIYSCYYKGVMTAKELNAALKAHGSGDFDQVRAILSKCWKACGKEEREYPSAMWRE